MYPVRYDLEFYVPEDDILYSHRRESFKTDIALAGWALYRKCSVSCKVLSGFLYPIRRHSS
jgi:hypothetical protein